jgi:hypothetical protein
MAGMAATAHSATIAAPVHLIVLVVIVIAVVVVIASRMK